MNLHSEQINEIMTALSKAQAEIRGAEKDSTNPHFKSKYATLASVWDACRIPLSSHGIAVTQQVVQDGDSQLLMTMLGHSSGQWLKSYMKLPIQRPGPQEMGSCMSYCRRYSLAALVGVVQEDDDGEKAESAVRYLNPSQVEEIRKEIGDDEYLEEKVCASFKVQTLKEIPAVNFYNIINRLKASRTKTHEKATA